nr:hypothetical protein [Tanacetum cinerariifolium]
MNGWLEEDDDVNENVNNEDIEDKDVKVEVDDEAELIFPYEMEGDQTPPPRDESSDSEPPRYESSDSVSFDSESEDEEADIAPEGYCDCFEHLREVDDEAELIFPYEMEGDQTPPPRDESSDSEPPRYESSDSVSFDSESEDEEADIAPEGYCDCFEHLRGNLEYRHGVLMRKIEEVSDAEVADSIAIREIY